MKITTVKYGRTFALGNFASERIDLEASIDEGKESAIDAFNQLREYAEQIHMKNHPHLYQQTNPELYSSEQPKNWFDNDKQEVFELMDAITLSPKQKIISQIQQCSDITVLKSFELLAKNNTEIKTAYDNRFNELSL